MTLKGPPLPESILKSLFARCFRAEGLKVEDELFALIADHSDHSFRDATKILEELSIQSKLTLQEGKNFLGLLKENFFAALKKNSIKDMLAWIEEFSQSGGNFKNLIESLLAELRLMLLAKHGIKTEILSEKIAADLDIVLLMKLLTEAYNNLKLSPIESLPLEIAIVEYYNRKSS